jgi:hypothetical protein
MDEEPFRDGYPNDLSYVPVHASSLTIDPRASFTQDWILNNADTLIGYASAENKKQVWKTVI